MPYFASPRTHDAARLANRVVGKVVVQDKLLAVGAPGIGVKALCIISGAKRGGY